MPVFQVSSYEVPYKTNYTKRNHLLDHQYYASLHRELSTLPDCWLTVMDRRRRKFKPNLFWYASASEQNCVSSATSTKPWESSFWFLIWESFEAIVKTDHTYDTYIVSFTLTHFWRQRLFIRHWNLCSFQLVWISNLRPNSLNAILLHNFTTHSLYWYLTKTEEIITLKYWFGHHWVSPALNMHFLFQNMLGSSP